ncbi:hypothetical protein [Chryseobacterium geocarposphaerae]|uniref:Uncharacterized protein n=1 Tax=Chryseobacterium geocarposphaerae TaxID=1416776 RepID=A0A2M9CAQ2_9FLAO|nr:hypothetical protein [Chryseobacterium geocarposphaerae]PJJ67891.1 hypothetical protein CLV73_1911 [Chryseobacterium geocarposphaerae]
MVNPEENALISLYFFNIPPDLPTIKDVNSLRDFYRQSIAASGGGLIEVSAFDLQNFPSVKTIFKVPQQEGGMTYLTAVTIPFENCSFVIKTQAVEIGTTGIRDAFVLNRFLENGKVTFDGNGLKNWFEDPYDPAFKEGTLMNKSEREEYDTEFPQHPLSIARASIDKAIREIDFKPEVMELAGFNK